MNWANDLNLPRLRQHGHLQGSWEGTTGGLRAQVCSGLSLYAHQVRIVVTCFKGRKENKHQTTNPKMNIQQSIFPTWRNILECIYINIPGVYLLPGPLQKKFVHLWIKRRNQLGTGWHRAWHTGDTWEGRLSLPKKKRKEKKGYSRSDLVIRKCKWDADTRESLSDLWSI